MSLILKGGTWANSEDEILKAAISKYGLNEWARIASLLPKKTALQCRARWYEYLSPSVKKDEWLKAEDEKLLKAVKIFPNQWGTISKAVGRTSHQCYERYKDIVMSGQPGNNKSIPDMATEAPKVPMLPHLIPATPDPVVQDQSMKESLMEVRARLANTLGKKSKRQLKEKLMEESRKLAKIQRDRELKAAGIEIPDGSQSRKKKNKLPSRIDEIIEVPEGPYSTEAEVSRDPKPFKPMTIEEADANIMTWKERAQREIEAERKKIRNDNSISETYGKEREQKQRGFVVSKLQLMFEPDISCYLTSEFDEEFRNIKNMVLELETGSNHKQNISFTEEKTVSQGNDTNESIGSEDMDCEGSTKEIKEEMELYLENEEEGVDYTSPSKILLNGVSITMCSFIKAKLLDMVNKTEIGKLKSFGNLVSEVYKYPIIEANIMMTEKNASHVPLFYPPNFEAFNSTKRSESIREQLELLKEPEILDLKPNKCDDGGKKSVCSDNNDPDRNTEQMSQSETQLQCDSHLDSTEEDLYHSQINFKECVSDAKQLKTIYQGVGGICEDLVNEMLEVLKSSYERDTNYTKARHMIEEEYKTLLNNGVTPTAYHGLDEICLTITPDDISEANIIVSNQVTNIKSLSGKIVKRYQQTLNNELEYIKLCDSLRWKIVMGRGELVGLEYIHDNMIDETEKMKVEIQKAKETETRINEQK